MAGNNIDNENESVMRIKDRRQTVGHIWLRSIKLHARGKSEDHLCGTNTLAISNIASQAVGSPSGGAITIIPHLFAQRHQYA